MTKELKETKISNKDTGEKLIFVKRKPGTWGIHNHFKPFNPAVDEDGWWFKLDNKKAIYDLCNKAEVLFPELKTLPLIAKNFDDFKRICLETYFIDKEANIEEEINKKLIENKITSKDCVFYTENNLKELAKTQDGEKLVIELQNCKKKIEQIRNEDHIAEISPATPTSINNFEYLFENNSEKQLVDELRMVAPSIETGYSIDNEPVEFPGGAVTIIAGATGHGKTTALINFSLGVLEKNQEKNVYFFSYEEARPFILMSYLNVWMHEEITKGNNLKSIEECFRSNSVKFIKKDKQALFKKKKDLFFKQFINTGRLKVFYSDMGLENLVKAISCIKERDKNVGLICIDYMQLLNLENRMTARHEEIKELCSQLKDCSIKTGLSIVLAAQFNRTVLTEENVLLTNIGEGGGIERFANMVIGIFNRNKNKDKKEPVIYMNLLKQRHGKDNISEVFDFDGNLGKIKPQKKDPAEDYPNMKENNSKQKISFSG